MYETIKKFLAEGGKCLLIENGKSVGVVLTIEEYEKIKENKKETKVAEESTEKFSAELSDINFNDDDITIENLGLDELPN